MRTARLITRRAGGLALSLMLGFNVRTRPALAQAVWEMPPRSTPEDGTNGWVATVPFAADGNPMILVPVRVNGSPPGWWALDSGSSVCLVDRGAARRLGLATRGTRQIHGGGRGTVGIDSVSSRVRLDFGGGFTTACDHIAAVDLTGLTADVGRPETGVLGYDLFARYVVEVDFAAHTLRLYDPARYRYAGTGDTVPITLVRRQPRVTIQVHDGGRPAVARTLIVDSGSGDAVDDSLVRQSTTAPRYAVSTSGLGASYHVEVGTLDTVRIGRFTLAAVPGVASDVALIGNAVWGRFTCVFDYPHGRLFLEPNARFGGTFDRGPLGGLELFAAAYRRMPTVSTVHERSAAARAGLQVGDVLVTVDGRPATDFGVERLSVLLNRPGNVYRVGIARGGTHLERVLRL
ncbi:hypothetical protein tb265_47460 [Gemmatimonadetes bacterium T265]|nr:hypothetical protein tb265_47460 [Gemmatimonadetes bacterium T265]